DRTYVKLHLSENTQAIADQQARQYPDEQSTPPESPASSAHLSQLARGKQDDDEQLSRLPHECLPQAQSASTSPRENRRLHAPRSHRRAKLRAAIQQRLLHAPAAQPAPRLPRKTNLRQPDSRRRKLLRA